MSWNPTTRLRHQQQQEKALEYVTRVWGADRKCAICGNHDWNITEVVGLEPWPKDPFTRGVIPVIPIVCVTCGNTLFLSAVAAGIVPEV